MDLALRGRVLVGLAATAWLAGGGCRPEERVVSGNYFFKGMEGVRTKLPTRGSDAPEVEAPVVSVDALSTVIENPDGSVTLVSRSGRDLMGHIARTLRDNDAELFATQVLSEATRREFVERGRDPREALAMLKPDERDIVRLFSRMPMGEHSPSAVLRPQGGKVFRVELTGPGRRGLAYRGFDMILEGRDYRLRWLVPN